MQGRSMKRKATVRQGMLLHVDLDVGVEIRIARDVILVVVRDEKFIEPWNARTSEERSRPRTLRLRHRQPRLLFRLLHQTCEPLLGERIKRRARNALCLLQPLLWVQATASSRGRSNERFRAAARPEVGLKHNAKVGRQW